MTVNLIDNNKIVKIPEFIEQDDVSYAVLSDSHIGHIKGYLPANAYTKKGQRVPQNPLQRKMHRETIRYLKEIGEVDILILLGDLCEGKQVRTAGIELHDADTDTMVKWAIEAILEWCSYLKPKVIVMVKGTDYHTTVGIGGDLDYQVANILSQIYKVYYGVELYLKIGQLIWYLRHYYPTVSVNRMMPLEKLFRFRARDFASGRLKVIADVMGFAHIHLHLFSKIEQRTYMFTAPALKGKDNYMKSRGYGWEPDLGVLSLKQTGKYIDQHRFYRINTI